MMIYNGQSIPVTGWWQARCGSRLFLTDGSLAPVCPRHMTQIARWQLITPIGGPRPVR